MKTLLLVSLLAAPDFVFSQESAPEQKAAEEKVTPGVGETKPDAVPEMVPAVEDKAAPNPANVTPTPSTTPTPAMDITPSTAAAQPVTPPPAAEVPKAEVGKSDSVTAATYTRDIAVLYDALAKDARDFTRKGHERLLTFKKEEDDLQAQIDATQKQIDEKKSDTSKDGKRAVKDLNKQLKQLNKQLNAARKETSRQKDAIRTGMWEMQKRHLESIKLKYPEIDTLLKAAE